MKSLSGTDGEAVAYKLLIAARALPPEYLVTAILLVGEERMPYRLHVSSYLMRTPRLQTACHKRDEAQRLYEIVVSHGRLALLAGRGEHSHTRAISWIAGNISLNGTVCRIQRSEERRVG